MAGAARSASPMAGYCIIKRQAHNARRSFLETKDDVLAEGGRKADIMS